MASKDKQTKNLTALFFEEEHKDENVEVSAVGCSASMQTIENEELGEVAQTVRSLLKKVIENL